MVTLGHLKERHHITVAQEMLLNTLQSCLVKKKPFTIEDLRRVYSVASLKTWNTKHPEDMDVLAMTWLQRNLGACVLKGRLLVLPVINITLKP